jgi:hypothetical protein
MQVVFFFLKNLDSRHRTIITAQQKGKNIMKIEITTYNPAKNYSGPHFFILSRGMNAGKPLTQPCRNCFVVQCETMDTMDDLFWLCYGLWQSKSFHYFILGSVIPFVRISEIRTFIFDCYDANRSTTENIRKITEVMQLCNKKIVLYKKQAELTERYKMQYFKMRVKIAEPRRYYMQ